MEDFDQGLIPNDNWSDKLKDNKFAILLDLAGLFLLSWGNDLRHQGKPSR